MAAQAFSLRVPLLLRVRGRERVALTGICRRAGCAASIRSIARAHPRRLAIPNPSNGAPPGTAHDNPEWSAWNDAAAWDDAAAEAAPSSPHGAALAAQLALLESSSAAVTAARTLCDEASARSKTAMKDRGTALSASKTALQRVDAAEKAKAERVGTQASLEAACDAADDAEKAYEKAELNALNASHDEVVSLRNLDRTQRNLLRALSQFAPDGAVAALYSALAPADAEPPPAATSPRVAAPHASASPRGTKRPLAAGAGGAGGAAGPRPAKKVRPSRTTRLALLYGALCAAAHPLSHAAEKRPRRAPHSQRAPEMSNDVIDLCDGSDSGMCACFGSARIVSRRTLLMPRPGRARRHADDGSKGAEVPLSPREIHRAKRAGLSPRRAAALSPRRAAALSSPRRRAGGALGGAAGAHDAPPPRESSGAAAPRSDEPQAPVTPLQDVTIVFSGTRQSGFLKCPELATDLNETVPKVPRAITFSAQNYVKKKTLALIVVGGEGSVAAAMESLRVRSATKAVRMASDKGVRIAGEGELRQILSSAGCDADQLAAVRASLTRKLRPRSLFGGGGGAGGGGGGHSHSARAAGAGGASGSTIPPNHIHFMHLLQWSDYGKKLKPIAKGPLFFILRDAFNDDYKRISGLQPLVDGINTYYHMDHCGAVIKANEQFLASKCKQHLS